MGKKTEDSAEIVAAIQPETLTALESIASTFHISIGEAIDRVVGIYGKTPEEQRKRLILTELADILGPENYSFR